VLEKLITFEPESADLEDRGDHKPDADDEQDGPPLIAESSISLSAHPSPAARSRAPQQASAPSAAAVQASTMSGARQVSGRSRQTYASVTLSCPARSVIDLA
jgi:hypothetical protein